MGTDIIGWKVRRTLAATLPFSSETALDGKHEMTNLVRFDELENIPITAGNIHPSLSSNKSLKLIINSSLGVVSCDAKDPVRKYRTHLTGRRRSQLWISAGMNLMQLIGCR